MIRLCGATICCPASAETYFENSGGSKKPARSLRPQPPSRAAYANGSCFSSVPERAARGRNNSMGSYLRDPGGRKLHSSPIRLSHDWCTHGRMAVGGAVLQDPDAGEEGVRSGKNSVEWTGCQGCP